MKLNPKKIIEKKFESVINGYNPTKVDQFLDVIIEDYNEMIETINTLKKENEELNKKNEELTKNNNKDKFISSIEDK